MVLPYVNDDLIIAKKLRDAGCAAVMPLAAPIGSGLGIQNPANLRLILEEITDIPVIVDAGVGTASDAAIAMEMGVDGILMNTAIAGANDPVRMAIAMRLARRGRAPRLGSGPDPEEALRHRLEPAGRGRALAKEVRARAPGRRAEARVRMCPLPPSASSLPASDSRPLQSATLSHASHALCNCVHDRQASLIEIHSRCTRASPRLQPRPEPAHGRACVS